MTEISGEVAVFETETPEPFPTTLVGGGRFRVKRDGPVGEAMKAQKEAPGTFFVEVENRPGERREHRAGCGAGRR